MCASEDGKYCHLLTPAEQRVQHNFEERKGPYPASLAQRLEREGKMSEWDHFWRSVIIREKNAVERLPYGDCLPVEEDYMAGRRHDLPPQDPLLTQETQKALFAKMLEYRRQRFINRLIGEMLRSVSPYSIEITLAYPEFTLWFKDVIARRKQDPAKSWLGPLHSLLFIVTVCSDRSLLEQFILKLDEETLDDFADLLLERFFLTGCSGECHGFIGMAGKALSPEHQASFQPFIERDALLKRSSGKTRNDRRLRRTLKKSLARDMQAWIAQKGASVFDRTLMQQTLTGRFRTLRAQMMSRDISPLRLAA